MCSPSSKPGPSDEAGLAAVRRPDEPDLELIAFIDAYVVHRDVDWRGFLKSWQCPTCRKCWSLVWNDDTVPSCCTLDAPAPPAKVAPD